MNKKQRQKKKQLKRLENSILKGKIDLSLLDNQVIKIPEIKQAIDTIQKAKKKTKIRKSQLSKLKKSSSFGLIEENDNQLSFSRKKQRKKKRKQKKSKSYKVKQGAKVATTPDKVDEMHPEVSTETVADSPLIAVQRVRNLCKYHSTYGSYYLIKYFESIVHKFGELAIGKALLSMKEDYIEQCEAIIYESKIEYIQDKTWYFIRTIADLSGEPMDFWTMQENLYSWMEWYVEENYG